MGRNLFQLFFGKSVPLEPFPVLDTANYLGVKESAPGFKKKKKSENPTTTPLPISRPSLVLSSSHGYLPVLLPWLKPAVLQFQ